MNHARRLFTVVLGLLAATALATVADGDRALERGDYETAVAEYQAAFELRSSNVQALYKLAQAKTYLAETLSGDAAERLYEEAAEHARAATEAAPEEPEGYFELARALGRLAQFRGVLASLEIAGEVKNALEYTLELDPDHGGAYHALALWHLEVPWIAGGRTGQVRPLFEQALAAEPGSIAHRVGYAEALIALGDPAAAREQLEQALELNARTYRDEQDLDTARMRLGEL